MNRDNWDAFKVYWVNEIGWRLEAAVMMAFATAFILFVCWVAWRYK